MRLKTYMQEEARKSVLDMRGIVKSLHYLCTNGKIYVSLANFQDVDFIDALNLPLAHKVMRKMMHTA